MFLAKCTTQLILPNVHLFCQRILYFMIHACFYCHVHAKVDVIEGDIISKDTKP